MHYEYTMPEILEHLLHTMHAVLHLADGLDSATQDPPNA